MCYVSANTNLTFSKSMEVKVSIPLSRVFHQESILNICNLWILLRKIVIYLVGGKFCREDFYCCKRDVILGICFITPACFNIQTCHEFENFCLFTSNSTIFDSELTNSRERVLGEFESLRKYFHIRPNSLSSVCIRLYKHIGRSFSVSFLK